MDYRNRIEEWTVASRIEPWDVLVPVHSRQKCPFSKSGNVKKNYYLGTVSERLGMWIEERQREEELLSGDTACQGHYAARLEPRGLSGGSLAALGKAPQINAAEVGEVCRCAGDEEV